MGVKGYEMEVSIHQEIEKQLIMLFFFNSQSNNSNNNIHKLSTLVSALCW